MLTFIEHQIDYCKWPTFKFPQFKDSIQTHEYVLIMGESILITRLMFQ